MLSDEGWAYTTKGLYNEPHVTNATEGGPPNQGWGVRLGKCLKTYDTTDRRSSYDKLYQEPMIEGGPNKNRRFPPDKHQVPSPRAKHGGTLVGSYCCRTCFASTVGMEYQPSVGLPPPTVGPGGVNIRRKRSIGNHLWFPCKCESGGGCVASPRNPTEDDRGSSMPNVGNNLDAKYALGSIICKQGVPGANQRFAPTFWMLRSDT